MGYLAKDPAAKVGLIQLPILKTLLRNFSKLSFTNKSFYISDNSFFYNNFVLLKLKFIKIKTMKKVLFALSIFTILFYSCGDTKKKEIEKEVETSVEEIKEVKEKVEKTVKADPEELALGEKLFNEKTCSACHQLDTKVIGPSIKDIATIYNEKNGNMIKFLKGEDAAIVDTDPGQVAIMKANLDGFVKDLSDKELNALAAYFQNSIK